MHFLAYKILLQLPHICRYCPYRPSSLKVPAVPAVPAVPEATRNYLSKALSLDLDPNGL